MSKQKKQLGKIARARRYYRNNKRRVLLIALGAILIAVGTYNVFHKRSQTMLKRDLDAVGVELDSLGKTLDEALPDHAVVERKQWCIRNSRKFDPGPINCSQRLLVIAEGVGDEQLLQDTNIIKQALEKSWFGFSQDNTNRQKTSFDDEDYSIHLSFNFTNNVKRGKTYCDAVFDGYGSKRATNYEFAPYSQYELEVKCSGNGNFDRFIYPELE